MQGDLKAAICSYLWVSVHQFIYMPVCVCVSHGCPLLNSLQPLSSAPKWLQILQDLNTGCLFLAVQAFAVFSSLLEEIIFPLGCSGRVVAFLCYACKHLQDEFCFFSFKSCINCRQQRCLLWCCCQSCHGIWTMQMTVRSHCAPLRVEVKPGVVVLLACFWQYRSSEIPTIKETLQGHGMPNVQQSSMCGFRGKFH